MEIKESWSSSTHIRQNRLQNKDYYKRQGKMLHKNQGINSKRTYNNCKHFCPQIGAPQYIRQMITAIKAEINSNTIIVRDFNTPLIPVANSSRQKINKETQVLNDTLDDMGLTDIYRTFHLKAAEYTFISSTHGTFSRIDHILGHKSSLSKFKKIEIVLSTFFDDPAVRNQLQKKKKLKKHKYMKAKQQATQ